MHTHVVFFWLKEPDNADHRRLMSEGLAHLVQDPNVKDARIGGPAGTSREVVENSYDFGLVLKFDTLADHDVYQTGRNHDDFLETCQTLWSRVQVFDLEHE